MAATAASAAPTGLWTRRTGAAMPMTAAMGDWRSWAVNPSWKSTFSLSAGATSSAPAELPASDRPASVTGRLHSAFAKTWAPMTANTPITPTSCARGPPRPAEAVPQLLPCPPEASTPAAVAPGLGNVGTKDPPSGKFLSCKPIPP